MGVEGKYNGRTNRRKRAKETYTAEGAQLQALIMTFAFSLDRFLD